jgi:hypothetical protein
MKSILSLLMGKNDRAQAVEEGAIALLASPPTTPGSDLDKWADALAPHFTILAKGGASKKEGADGSDGKGHGEDLVALPRAAVARLLASDELCVEDEYHAYLFAAAHAELHAVSRWRALHPGKLPPPHQMPSSSTQVTHSEASRKRSHSPTGSNV